MKRYKPLLQCLLKEGNIFPKLYYQKILDKIDYIVKNDIKEEDSPKFICDLLTSKLLLTHQIGFKLEENI